MARRAHEIGVPVIYGSESVMERGRIDLAPGDLVAGSVGFVLHALRQLKVIAPSHTPYPSVLAPWLRRKVSWHPTLSGVLADLQVNNPVFVKPAKGWKRFTGFVAQVPDDPRFNGASRRDPVWTSSTLDLLSEWRVYVVRGSIRAIKFADYGGLRTVTPDESEIHQAVTTLVQAGHAPAGFAIDFAVDSLGRTVLVEVNDGFSLGAYDDIDGAVYWDVIAARRSELLASSSKVSAAATFSNEYYN